MELRDIDYGENYLHKGWTHFSLGPETEKRLCFYDTTYRGDAIGTAIGSGMESPLFGAYRPTPEVIEWLEKNCVGAWRFFQIKVVFEFIFENADDAMRFKLAWG
jgi:hypothetical protein